MTGRPCVGCAYDLRGLPVGVRCPECGTPVGDSLRARYLRDGGVDYLSALRQGPRVAALVLVAGLVALAWTYADASYFHWPHFWKLTLVFPLLAYTGMALAAWRITVAPGNNSHDRLRRCLLRGVVLIPLLAHGVYALAFYRAATERSSEFSVLGRVAAAWMCVCAAEFAGAAVAGVFIARLASRLPSPRLARAIRLVAVALALTLLAPLSLAIYTFVYYVGFDPGLTLARHYQPIQMVGYAGRRVFGTAAIVLLYVFARRLRDETEILKSANRNIPVVSSGHCGLSAVTTDT